MPRLLKMWDGGPVKIAGHGRRGRRRRRLRGRPPPRPRARPDRAVARVRPARARQRLLLHARHQHRSQGPPRAAAPRLQPGHRAGARVDAQARGAGAGRGLAGPRRARSPATSARSSSTPPTRPDGQARRAGAAPSTSWARRSRRYTSPGGDELVLRGAMTPEDAARSTPTVLRGGRWRRRTPGSARSSSCSSASPCAGTVAGVPTEGQKALLHALPRRDAGRAPLDPRRAARAPRRALPGARGAVGTSEIGQRVHASGGAWRLRARPAKGG